MPDLIVTESVQRVWTVLEEKGIAYQYVEVNPYDKPESLLKLNPRGLVPTLKYENKPLYESTVICEFLEDAYPDHGPKLLPSDPYSRAKLRIWTDFVTSRVIPSFHRVKFSGPSTAAVRLNDDLYSTCNSNLDSPQLQSRRSVRSSSDISKNSQTRWTRKDHSSWAASRR